MSKRGSGKQITKDDDVDRLAEGGDEGSFEDQKASAEEMKTRKIFVPKRMLSAAGAQAAAPAAAAPAAETPAFPVFKFGSTETPAAAPAETNGKSSFPTFNFGTPSTTEETKSETVTSAASASQSTDSSSSSSSSSSSESTAAASTSSSSSSSDSATTSASSGAFSGFTFGSGGFNFGNATWGKLESFSSIAPSSSSAFSISSSSSTFQFDNTAPVLKDAPAVVLDEFKNKAPEASGEEDETTVCKVNARAFVLEKKTEKAEEGAEKKAEAASSSEEAATATKWAERGRGDVKINKRQDGSKTVFRLLMRAEKTHRVVINAPLLSSFKFTPENEKFIRFASVDQDLKPVAYLLKFASKDEFRTFSAGLTDAVGQLQGAEKTA